MLMMNRWGAGGGGWHVGFWILGVRCLGFWEVIQVRARLLETSRTLPCYGLSRVPNTIYLRSIFFRDLGNSKLRICVILFLYLLGCLFAASIVSYLMYLSF